jgi:hypothetical protein
MRAASEAKSCAILRFQVFLRGLAATAGDLRDLLDPLDLVIVGQCCSTRINYHDGIG